MTHDTTLIATIAAAFVLALAFGFVAVRIRIPPLVGYLIAGIALGPFTPGIIADANFAAQLAEIGVILLMFGVGLHFSFKDLFETRRVALPGALAQMAAATAIGAALAMLWGWSVGAGIVFGLSLSVASSVVLLRALEQRMSLDSPEGHIAMGWLIVEDMAMVLAVVILPVLAQPEDAAGGDNVATAIALVLAKIAVFVALALVVGTRVVPWLLMRVTATGSRELFTLAVLAVALGIAYGSAVLFDVSLALGAFFAGVVLGESDLSQRAAADSLPLKDAFAVLFFVSVGMLFDPSILLRDPLAVLAVLGIILLGKSLVAFAIVTGVRLPGFNRAHRVREPSADRGILLHSCGAGRRPRNPSAGGTGSDSRRRHSLDRAQSARVRHDPTDHRLAAALAHRDADHRTGRSPSGRQREASFHVA